LRIHGAIACASIVLLALSSIAYHRIVARAQAPSDPWKAIAEEKARFQKATKAAVRIDPMIRGQLLDPARALPSTHLHPYDQIAALFRYAKSCDPSALDAIHETALEKAKTWQMHRCTNEPLPPTFFSEHPFMHPSGRSFVRLALDEEPETYRNEAWIKDHAQFLHTSELRIVASMIALSDADRILAEASPIELQAFHANAPLVLTRDRVFFFERMPADDFAPSAEGVYLGYAVADWSKVQDDAAFRAVVALAGKPCPLREGNVCWTRNSASVEKSAWICATLAIIALIALGAAIASLFNERKRLHRRDEEERMFALTTLAHELRTPATAIGLSLEAFRTEFDALPENCQTELLRMLGDVERLNRVIAGSARYVKSRAGATSDRYAVKTIESIATFIEAVLEDHAGRIDLDKPDVDRAFRTDPYWLSVSIKNLVDNALVHGRPPVRVRVEVTPDVLEVRVEDHGSIEGHSLDELVRPFSAGRQSRGLGLGLSIVARTIRDLGGTLRLETQPTTFILRLRGER
jgi:signal transduction histidine kinase